jgi:putative transposase
MYEVMISIGGRKHWLWRAVDQDGYVLDGSFRLIATRRMQTPNRDVLARKLSLKQVLNIRLEEIEAQLSARRRVVSALRATLVSPRAWQ